MSINIIAGENIIIENIPEGSDTYYISTTAKDSYGQLGSLPTLNGEIISGDKTSSDYHIPGELTAGTGISISNGVISLDLPNLAEESY